MRKSTKKWKARASTLYSKRTKGEKAEYLSRFRKPDRILRAAAGL